MVIGGGNVAMDVTRSSIRLGADKVTCVYRRRQEDMTALPEEVEGAVAEGAELLTLQAPVRMESGPDGHVTALWTQPQIIGQADKNGRPSPNGADQPELRVPADIIIVAIGQGIETHGFEQSGIKIQRGGTILADSGTHLPDMEGVFAGVTASPAPPPSSGPLRQARWLPPTSTNIWATATPSRRKWRSPRRTCRTLRPGAE